MTFLRALVWTGVCYGFLLSIPALPLGAQQPTPPAAPGIEGPAKEKEIGDKQAEKLPGGIVVSKETTRIDGPRREDGRIDYLAAVNRRLSAGVTPENNAAAVLYQVVRMEFDEALRRKFFDRLGVEPPAEDDLFVSPAELAPPEAAAEPEKFAEFIGRFSDQLQTAHEQPWSAMNRPELAAWLKANEKQLAKVAEGMKRSRYYMPLVADDDSYMMVAVLLPGLAPTRDVGRAFAARAMLRLGQGKTDEARADLLSAHRLARHVGTGPTLIEALVGIAIDRLAISGDVALAHSGDLSADEARAYAAQLAKLPRVTDMVAKIDVGERYMFLDSVSTLAVEGPGALTELTGSDETTSETLTNLLGKKLIDWNEPLRIGNQWYDRMVAAGRITPYQKKIEAMDAFDEDLDKLVEQARDPLSLARRFFFSGKSPGQVAGAQMGNILISLLLPAVRAAVVAEDQQVEQFQLAQLALLLAAYHAEHDAYPAALDDLAPKYVEKLPRDVFTGDELKYRRTDGGYVLYSVGPNRTDDGGTKSPNTMAGDIVVATP